MNKKLIFPVLLIGLTSLIAQIVLMRELITIFYGNELSIGVTLACWLFWIAMGSWIGGEFITKRVKDNHPALMRHFAIGEGLLAFFLPLTLLGARCIPPLFGFVPGEIIGLTPMVTASFIIFAPLCLIGGILFVAGCQLSKCSAGGAAEIGYVYIAESLGAAAGGLAASFYLIRIFHPINIMAALACVNILTAFSLLQKRKLFAFVLTVTIGFVIIMTHLGWIDGIRRISLKKQWQSFELLTSENSIYGNIVATKKEDSRSFYVNGLYGFTVPDRHASETAAHLPLLEHPHPERVLLIGGGASGILPEVLRHAVKKVDYVELDPLLITIARRLLPRTDSLDDSRVTIITEMDGRRFIKMTDKRYDVVIINLPEPHTAQINRFYTEEFYKEAGDVLSEDGVLSFSMYSNPNYISDEQARFYNVIRNTLQKVFAEVVIAPGETNYFLASKEIGMLTLDPRLLTQRLNERNITAAYMRDYYLETELSEWRIGAFRQRLAQNNNAGINKDFRPVGYYYNMVLWSTYFSSYLKNIFKALNTHVIYGSAAIFLLFLLSPLALKKTIRSRATAWPILACVGTTGFAEIAFQIVTLISFQVIYGYVFYKLGIILTSFMMGLIAGGLLVTRTIERGGGSSRLFMRTQALICVYPLLLPVLFLIFSRFQSERAFWIGSNVVFPFLPVIAGLIGGFQFPLANKLYMERKKQSAGISASLTYGIDLFGSCIGALLVSIFLIPIIGIAQTCIMVAALNGAGLLLLVRLKS